MKLQINSRRSNRDLKKYIKHMKTMWQIIEDKPNKTTTHYFVEIGTLKQLFFFCTDFHKKFGEDIIVNEENNMLEVNDNTYDDFYENR